MAATDLAVGNLEDVQRGKHVDRRKQCERKKKSRLERGDARSLDEVHWAVQKFGARSGYRQVQNNMGVAKIKVHEF